MYANGLSSSYHARRPSRLFARPHEITNPSARACPPAVRDLKVALLLNIARAYSSRSDYATSVQACSAALAINPSSAKGLYLRGKALIAPASAGAFEMEEAMR